MRTRRRSQNHRTQSYHIRGLLSVDVHLTASTRCSPPANRPTTATLSGSNILANWGISVTTAIANGMSAKDSKETTNLQTDVRLSQKHQGKNQTRKETERTISTKKRNAHYWHQRSVFSNNLNYSKIVRQKIGNSYNVQVLEINRPAGKLIS